MIEVKPANNGKIEKTELVQTFIIDAIQYELHLIGKEMTIDELKKKGKKFVFLSMSITSDRMIGLYENNNIVKPFLFLENDTLSINSYIDWLYRTTGHGANKNECVLKDLQPTIEKAIFVKTVKHNLNGHFTANKTSFL